MAWTMNIEHEDENFSGELLLHPGVSRQKDIDSLLHITGLHPFQVND